jgi:hypothetical protein
VKIILSLSLVLLFAACNGDDKQEWKRPEADSGTPHKQTPGVCKIGDCPTPDNGLACCTPFAECGFDSAGTGLNCVPNPGTSQRTCVLADCELPAIGNACCTPFGSCGYDPFGNGLQCFSLPPKINTTTDPTCKLDKCKVEDGGAPACCLPNGKCGVDSLGIGFCFVPPAPTPDSGTTPPATTTTPPNDPSYDGQCPSFLGAFGPVWGCCSDYGVCGTFSYGECLLAIGTVIPFDTADLDAGMSGGPQRCKPPVRK